MSYASRLVAMSRDHVPTAPARAIGGDAEPPREEVIETEPRAAAPAAAAAAAPTAMRPMGPPAVAARAPARPASRPATSEVDPPQRPEPRPTLAPAMRETIERHTIVEPAPPPPGRAVVPPPPPAAPPSLPLPPQARWLAEDAARPDPLVASADDDALRELMRSVRQWTSSAPVVAEQDNPGETPASAATAQVATEVAAAAPAPTQVSIGNVTITVEDAPATSARRGPAPPRTASDRMARNHIRGG